MDQGAEIDAGPLIHCQNWGEALKRVIKEPLEIPRDPLVRQRRRRHHHGDTIDEFPPLFVRPALKKATEQLHGQTRRIPLNDAGHVMLLLRHAVSA